MTAFVLNLALFAWAHFRRPSLAVLSCAAFLMTLVGCSSSPTVAPRQVGTVIPLYTAPHPEFFSGCAVVVEHADGRTYLLTCQHVIEVACFWKDGMIAVEDVDIENDLALISVDGTIGHPFEIGEPPVMGETVFFVSGFEGVPIMTQGIVSNGDLSWYTADVEPGMSGGAVLDEDGRLVDIISGRFHQMSAGSGAHALQEFIR